MTRGHRIAPEPDWSGGTAATTPVSRLGVRELAVAIGAVIAAVALLPAVGGSVLWTRPFWLDEICCTYYPVAGAATPRAVVANVVGGQDYAPPLLHLLVWSVGRVAGVTPVAVRSLSLVCVALALLFVYAALRRRFKATPSAAGAIALASHPLVLAHAFEGRFYGPWLLGAALFAWSLGLDHEHERSWRRDLAVAGSSVFLAMAHWFGILSLGLMALGAAWAARRPAMRVPTEQADPSTRGRMIARAFRRVAPAALGVIVLLAFVPAVVSHRSDASAVDALWVPPLSAAQVGVMVRLFFLSTIPVLAVVLLVADALRGDRRSSPDGLGRVTHDASLNALLALALMPLVLVLVSAVLQPSMLDRYAILTVLSWAPLAALAVSTVSPRVQLALALGFAALVALVTARTIRDKRAFAEDARANATAFARAREMQLPVVFASLHAAYPVAGLQRESREALFLELPDSTIHAMVPSERHDWLRRLVTVERNIARGHARTYGFPVLASQARLDTTRAFLLVGSDDGFPRMYQRLDLFAAKVFPAHRARRLSPHLALFER